MAQYVPVAASQSEVQENVSISFSSSTLKILLAAIAVAVIIYFVYSSMSDTNDEKDHYETRSERMIAQARGNLKGALDDDLGEEDFSDLSELSDLSNLTEDMENYEKQRQNKRGNKKGKKGPKNNKHKQKMKENSEESGDFFEPLSEDNYNESSVKQQVEAEEEAREPYVEEQTKPPENQIMSNNMAPGGRMGPGMMGIGGMGGMGSNQLAGIPEE